MSDGSNLTTAEGLLELEAELAVLEGDGRREIAERIKTAREWGDLKENSEYHDAKNDQAHLETKIARLREKISDAVVVEEAPQGAGGVVGFGSTVRRSRPGRRRADVADRELPRRLAARGAAVGGIAGRGGAAGPRAGRADRGVAAEGPAHADGP